MSVFEQSTCCWSMTKLSEMNSIGDKFAGVGVTIHFKQNPSLYPSGIVLMAAISNGWGPMLKFDESIGWEQPVYISWHEERTQWVCLLWEKTYS